MRQPQDLKVESGSPFYLDVSADGVPPIRFQWFQAGVVCSANRSAPSDTGGTSEHHTVFRVQLQNSVGMVDSVDARVTIEGSHAYGRRWPWLTLYLY